MILPHLISGWQMNLNVKRIFPFAIFLSGAAQLVPQTLATPTLIKAGRLLDPRSGNALSPAAVLIENGKIKEVGAPPQLQAHAPANVTTIDLDSATLLPGLIDSHTHLLLNVTVPAEVEINSRYNGEFAPGMLLAIIESPNKRVLMGAQLAREDLESGFTTVRNLGHSGIDGDVALRDAINAGRLVGPRILASARKIAKNSKGGYVQNLNPGLARAILEQEFLDVNGPDSARQAVLENGFHDVDVIKVSIEDDIYFRGNGCHRRRGAPSTTQSRRPRLHSAQHPDRNRCRRGLHRARQRRH